MKTPITLALLGICSITKAQTVVQAVDTSNNTGFATKGVNVIQLTANAGPISGSFSYYRFIADRISLGFEVNSGACLFNHRTSTPYKSSVWPYYTFYKFKDNYYNRTFIQPGIKVNYHFSKHHRFDWYLALGGHVPIYLKKKIDEADQAAVEYDVAPTYWSIGFGLRWWLSKHICVMSEYGYGNGVVKVGLAYKF